jgi:hypothetical protein
MSEKVTKITTPEEEQQASQEVVNEELQGKILNFFVGIGGSSVYRVSSNSEEINLRDHIEAISTIEINTIASLLESPEDAKKHIELFLNMKKEIMSQAIDLVVGYSKVSEEDKEAIKALFK